MSIKYRGRPVGLVAAFISRNSPDLIQVEPLAHSRSPLPGNGSGVNLVRVVGVIGPSSCRRNLTAGCEFPVQTCPEFAADDLGLVGIGAAETSVARSIVRSSSIGRSESLVAMPRE